MDRSDWTDCEEEGREEVEEPELDMLEEYPPMMFRVVGMSEGEIWPICWNCATRFPISTNHVVPASSYCSWYHNWIGRLLLIKKNEKKKKSIINRHATNVAIASRC